MDSKTDDAKTYPVPISIAEQKMLNRIDGRDVIGLSVMKQSDANVRVADLVKAELSAM